MKYENVELHNVCDVFENKKKGGVGLSRYPLNIMDHINKGAQGMSKMTSNCEIRAILSQQGEAKVTIKLIDDNTVPPVASLYFGEFCDKMIYLKQNENTEIIIKEPKHMELMLEIAKKEKHPFNPRLVRIKFPTINTVNIISIEGDLSYPNKSNMPSKTMLSYGSSITHGACTIAPQGTYPGHCAKHLGYDVINLGVGGAAQMETVIADHIAHRNDWDIATLEMGINVRTWERKKFHDTVKEFVNRIVTKNPDKHIFCIDLFTYFADYNNDKESAPGFRESVKEISESFSSDKVHYVDGRTILQNPYGLMTDLVHPFDDGMIEMGRNLADLISTKLGL
jgi:hypothetical protein